MTFISPKAAASQMTCPHCGAIAHQTWFTHLWSNHNYQGYSPEHPTVGRCQHCTKNTLWLHGKMLFPDTGMAPPPNVEMPESVKQIYSEAASIHYKSPRGAAALLRLGVQLLCKELGEKGKNIDDDIGTLVKKGMPEAVQKSLDVVRVTGNHAVHPGMIDTDNPDTVVQLFHLLNIIVEYAIAMPKKVSGLFDNLPPKAKEAIEKRDK